MRRDGSAEAGAVMDALALVTGRMRRSKTAALSERGCNSVNATGQRPNLSAQTLAATNATICAMTLERAPFSAVVTSWGSVEATGARVLNVLKALM
jgi:hypothetical protein